MNMLIIVVLAALAGIIPALIAGGKGRSAAVWWLYGAALFPVAFAHAWWLPDDPDGGDAGGRKAAGRDQVLCRSCSEPIPVTATRCRYCGTENAAAAGVGDGAGSGEAGIEAWDDAFASLVKGGGVKGGSVRGGGPSRAGPQPQPPPHSPVRETYRRPSTPLVAAGVVATVMFLGVAVSVINGAINGTGLSQLWTMLDREGTPTGDEVALGERAARQSGTPQGVPAPESSAPEAAPSTGSSSAPSTADPAPPRPQAAPQPAPLPRPPVVATEPSPAPPAGEASSSAESPAAPVERAGRDGPDAERPSLSSPARSDDAAPEARSGPARESTSVATVPDKPPEPAEKPTAGAAVEPVPQQANREEDVGRPPSRPSGSGAGETVTAVGDLVYWIQRELSLLGYYRDEINGRAGNTTRDAIRAYQRSHNLTPTGEIDQTLITSLRRDAAGREGRRRGFNGRRPPGGSIATAEPRDGATVDDD